jgi:hypothetical protein
MSILLARRLAVDVTTDLTLAGGWIPLKRIQDFDPNLTSNIEDSGTYDTNGKPSGEVTMVDGQPTVTWLQQVISAVRDPGQMIVLNTTAQFGDSARCGMRWYDKNGLAGPDNGSALVIPVLKRSATNYKNLDAMTATCSITDGTLNVGISNPVAVASVPVLTGVSPSGAAVTTSIAIFGAFFTGTTGAASVKVGGTNVTSYNVVNDNLITAVVPAGSAGSAPVIVTNPTGASAAFPYTRGA